MHPLARLAGPVRRVIADAEARVSCYIDDTPPPQPEPAPEPPLPEEEIRDLLLEAAEQGESTYALLRGWQRGANPTRQLPDHRDHGSRRST